MTDTDALEKNPYVSLSALESLHTDVFGWALSRCEFDTHTAEDLVQQAYMEVLTGRARFDNKSSLRSFLFGIVQNLARSRFRRIASRLRLLRQFAPTLVPGESDAAPSGADGAVWQVVSTLPPRQRDVIELVFCRELTVEEASRVMGISVGTARVHYDRAKKALRQKLAAMGF